MAFAYQLMIDITNNMMTFSYVDVDFGCALSKCHDLSLNSRQTHTPICIDEPMKTNSIRAGKWYLLFVIYSTKYGLKMLWYAEIGTDSFYCEPIDLVFSLSLSLFLKSNFAVFVWCCVLNWPRIHFSIIKCLSLRVDVN